MIRPSSPQRKSKRTSRAALKRKADRLWSQRIRERGECELEGVDQIVCGGPLQAAHGFPRRYLGTRYVLLNGWCICAGHHRYYTDRWPEWVAIMRERLGTEAYEELDRLRRAFVGPLDYRTLALLSEQ